MPSPENGVYIVVGEMSVVVTAMRRNNRWTSHLPQDEDQDILVRNFSNLREVLNHVNDLEELEPTVFLSPFLDVIRAQDTTGIVTGLALQAINKFLSYDLLDAKCETAPTAVENIADAVTHARFVGMDPGSDEVVLLKILQVLRTLLLTGAGTLLTNESVCEIMQSCFRICFEIRLSELLRKSAEHSLIDMVQLLFCRLPNFPEDSKFVSLKKLKMKAGGMETNRSTKKRRSPRPRQMKPNSKPEEILSIPTPPSSAAATPESSDPCLMPGQELALTSHDSSLESSREPSEQPDLQYSPKNDLPLKIGLLEEPTFAASLENETKELLSLENVVHENILAEQKSPENVNLDSNVNIDSSGGPESLSNPGSNSTMAVDDLSSLRVEREGELVPNNENEGSGPLIPYGLPCVKELFRFLLSLINPLDKQNNEVMINIGLSLLTVSLESGADHIARYSCLLSLVKDEMCRNLFSLLSSEKMGIFAAAQRVSFLLFESMRTHLKLQLESYLTKLMDIVVSESPRISYDQREIALDSIVQLWRIPGLVTELYLNYDCDLYCSNLFEDLTKLLSKNAFPLNELYSTHLLSLDTLLTVIDSIESHCHYRILSESQLSKDNETNVDGKIEQLKSTDSIKDCSSKLFPTLPPSGYIMSLALSHSNLGQKNLSSLGEKRMPQIKPNRMKVSVSLPSHEELMAVKHKKKLLCTGTEHFNMKPIKGIAFLQEHGLLKEPLDPQEVATFLRDNPKLDKRMIGEYISNRKNFNVLEAFVKSFSFEEARIDEALRMYLETFRLPGEAPLISLLLEHFAEHWHRSNGDPFVNSDAAFTLAYAVIMLNVDQHNYNVKRQNIPMTLEEFKKNLSKVNGNKNFDEEMLEEIYVAIKCEEIVMPAEQVGLVKENYLWKVLLRRGASKEGAFCHAPNGLFDHDLFSLSWGPTVAALSFVFDKSSDGTIIQKAISGFRKCAMISAHYGMSDVFDNLVISLCKYTTLLSTSETPEQLAVSFGSNTKAQLAARTVFKLAHRHGDILREGWKNLLDCVLQLFRAKLLPKSMVEAEDFIAPNGVIALIRDDAPTLPRMEPGLLSSFYSYITLTADSQVPKAPTPEEEALKEAATLTISDCHPEQLITESKFLRLDSLQELMKALIYECHGPETNPTLTGPYDEDSAVFLLELLVKIVLQNRDRVSSIWPAVQDHLYSLMMTAAVTDYFYLLERSIVGILRISIRMMRKEEMGAQVLQSMKLLLHLKPSTLYQVSCQVAFGIHELLRTSAANIHSSTDWAAIFTLLESVGAGAKPGKSLTQQSIIDDAASDPGAQSDSEISRLTQDSGHSTDRGYTSDSELYENAPRHHHRGSMESISSTSGWILVGKDDDTECVQMKPLPVNQFNIILDQELQAHDPNAFVKSCESLAFLIRDVAHITPHNFESCVHCIRTFVEASLDGGQNNQKRVTKGGKDVKDKKSPRLLSKRKEDARSKSRSRSSPSHNQGYEADDEDRSDKIPSGYQEASLQLLDLMHTLHIRAASIFQSWAKESGTDDLSRNLWSGCWCPLLQGIARLCCDKRRTVRTSALTYLQRALLVHDLQVLTAVQWEACFNQVLFPLLSKLLENVNPNDPMGMEETRVRGATLLCKVFLQHLNPLLTLTTFTALWLTILDFMDKYMHAEGSDLLKEAIPESLKNMLLVMETASVFQRPEEGGNTEDHQLWLITWDRIDSFLPGLRHEVFKPLQPQQGNNALSPEMTEIALAAATQEEAVNVSSQSEVSLHITIDGLCDEADVTSPLAPVGVAALSALKGSPELSMNAMTSLGGLTVNCPTIITSSVSMPSSVILHPPTQVSAGLHQFQTPGSPSTVPLVIDTAFVRPMTPIMPQIVQSPKSNNSR